MFKISMPLIATLFFVQPVFAQEKAPKLPDYTKLELSGWELDKVLYKGNLAYILHESYEINKGQIIVFYKPISQDQYQTLKTMDQQGLNREDLEKQIFTLAGKEPLFVYYLESEYDAYVYIYEKTSKWYECYRLWQSRWKPVNKFINPEASEDKKDMKKIEEFIEQRYGLRW